MAECKTTKELLKTIKAWKKVAEILDCSVDQAVQMAAYEEKNGLSTVHMMVEAELERINNA